MLLTFVCFRIKDFDQKLLFMDKQIQTFKKKAVMTPEEIRKNVQILSGISNNLESAVCELEVNTSHRVWLRDIF